MYVLAEVDTFWKKVYNLEKVEYTLFFLVLSISIVFFINDNFDFPDWLSAAYEYIINFSDSAGKNANSV